MTVLGNWKARLADAEKVLMDVLFASCKMKEVTTLLPPLFIPLFIVVWPADGKGQNITLRGLLLIVFGKQWLCEWTNRFVCLANIPKVLVTPHVLLSCNISKQIPVECLDKKQVGLWRNMNVKKIVCFYTQRTSPGSVRYLLARVVLHGISVKCHLVEIRYTMFHVRSCADTSDKEEFAMVCYWQCWSHFWFIWNLALKTKLL